MALLSVASRLARPWSTWGTPSLFSGATPPSSTQATFSQSASSLKALSPRFAPLDIPALGYGTWQVRGDNAQRCVAEALRAGYRHLDTAAVYENEVDIGLVLAAAFGKSNPTFTHTPPEASSQSSDSVQTPSTSASAPPSSQSSSPAPTATEPSKATEAATTAEPVQRTLLAELVGTLPKLQRSDVWVTSKLWNTHHESEHVLEACQATLERLQLEQLDLYLMHWPVAFPYDNEDFYPEDGKSVPVPLAETWHAMETLVEKGLTRYIGVSNFSVGQMAELIRHPKTKIRPAVNQFELHPHLTQTKLVQYCQKKGVLVQGYSPLGAGRSAENLPSLLAEPVVLQLADKYGVSPAAILLRWQLQQGFCTIPRSQNSQRIQSNFLDPLQFELSADDIAKISALNQNHRYVAPKWCEFNDE